MVLQYNCNAENSEKFIASSSGVKYILVLKNLLKKLFEDAIEMSRNNDFS